MRTAMGLVMAVLGGILVYDGFAGRSLWTDILTVLRGQALQGNKGGLPTSTSNPNAAANPNLVGGGDLGPGVGAGNTGGNSLAGNTPINPPGTVPSGGIGQIIGIGGIKSGNGGGSF